MNGRGWSVAWAARLTATIGSFAVLEWLAYRHRYTQGSQGSGDRPREREVD